MLKKIINWFKSYWYYYKYYFIFGIFAAAGIIFVIVSSLLTTKPDLSVVMTTYTPINDYQRTGIEAIFAEYGEDLNKDGTKLIALKTINFPAGNLDPKYTDTLNSKLQIELVTAESFLYLVDENMYKVISGDNLFEDLGELFPDIKGLEGKKFLWQDPFITSLKGRSNPKGEYYLCLIKIKNTMHKENKEALEVYNASRRMLERIIRDYIKEENNNAQ